MSFSVMFTTALSLVLFLLAFWPSAAISQMWFNRLLAAGLFFFVLSELFSRMVPTH